MAEIQVRNVSKDFLDASGKPFSCVKGHFIYMEQRGKYQFHRGKRQWEKYNGPPFNRFGTPHQWRDFAGWREHCQMELWTMA